MHKIHKWKVQGSKRITNGIWSDTELSCNSGKGSTAGIYFHGVALLGIADP